DALGDDPFVIAECLARPALAERLLTNWYVYDQRIHGELKQRAEAKLHAHPSTEQMKKLGGKYSEIEFVRGSGGGENANRGNGHRISLDSNEWEETIQRLALSFNDSRSEFTNGRDGLPGRPSLSARPAVAPYQALPLGKLSSLQEDESRYYA